MQFRLYLLDITELEDTALLQKTLSLMDSYRKGKVYRYNYSKDRMHQIAAGLLLQLGLLELELPEAIQAHEEFNGASSDGEVYICQITQVIQALEHWQFSPSQEMGTVEAMIKLPIETIYTFGEKGKPYWQQEFLESLPFSKKFSWFSLSHSGQYAALAIADVEIGLDIQEPRQTKYIKEDYVAFSRMESYVKCTGEGCAAGASFYREREGKIPGVRFLKIEAIDAYAIYLCSRMNKK